MSWSGRPTRVFRYKDGFIGYFPYDRQFYPECYGEDGWPIDPATGARLEIYEEPVRETLGFRKVVKVIVSFVAGVASALLVLYILYVAVYFFFVR